MEGSTQDETQQQVFQWTPTHSLDEVSNSEDISYDQYEKIKAAEDQNIIKVEVRKTTLEKMRRKISEIPIGFLGVSDFGGIIAGAGLSGFISGLTSNLDMSTKRGAWTYLLSLFATLTGAFVFMYFRNASNTELSNSKSHLDQLIQDILGSNENIGGRS